MLPLLLALTAAAATSDVDQQALVDAYESGRLGQAKKLATALLERPEAPSTAAAVARLVRLFATLRQGRAAEGLAAITELRAHGPALGEYLDYLEAGVLSALQRCEEAQILAGALADDSPFAPLAWGRVASCWVQQRDEAHATEALTRFDALADNETQQAEALTQRARLAERAGRLREARDLYRQVLIEFSLTSYGAAARDRIVELEQRGVRAKPLSPEELLPRADDERSRQRPAQARRTYRQIMSRARRATGELLRLRARLGLVELDIVEQRYGGALSSLDALLAKTHDPGVRAHALFLRGDVLSRRGRVREAMASFTQAVDSHPEQGYAAEAALSAARLAYTTRDFETARRFARWLQTHPIAEVDGWVITEDGAFGTGHDPVAMRDHGAWLLAWSERRATGEPSAIDGWLSAITVDGTLGPQALYWRMRLAREAGDQESAQSFAQALAEKAPTSFYALAARELLCVDEPTCELSLGLNAASAPPIEAPRKPVSEPRALKAALVLFEHGLTSEARRVVRILPATVLPQADKIAAAWIYARMGDHYRAALVTRRAVTQPREQLADPTLLELAFPRPFQEAVQSAAASYELPAELLYAVIREESAFNPTAVSPRGARGLMQMIRPTAMRIAKQMAALRFHPRKLFDPSVSVRFGAHYIAWLLEEFDGDLAAVIASYHAGETNVRRWKQRNPGLTTDEFIEEIPFASTRRYVKKVLASFGLYRLLYRPDDGGMNLRFTTAATN